MVEVKHKSQIYTAEAVQEDLCTYSTRISLFQQVVLRVRKRIEVLQRRYPPHLCSWHKTSSTSSDTTDVLAQNQVKSLDLTSIFQKRALFKTAAILQISAREQPDQNEILPRVVLGAAGSTAPPRCATEKGKLQ
jgi:hypothetical protein